MLKLTKSQALHMVEAELDSAMDKHPLFNSPHEGYAVLKEKVDEMWDDIKKNKLVEAKKEAAQVAAMAIKFLMS